MLKPIYRNRLLFAVLGSLILMVSSSCSQPQREPDTAARLEYKQWHLPDGAKARIGAGQVHSMAYAPEGNLLAAVSDIGVWIFDAQTAQPQHLLAPHTGIINSISFSPDGRILAVGCEDGTAQLWDTSTGEHQQTFTRDWYRWGVKNVFFMLDGHTLAVVGLDILDLWDIHTKQRKTSPSGVRYIPETYMNIGDEFNRTFSSDGKTIASWSTDTFRFYDIATAKEIRTFKVETRGQRVAFSSDLKTLALSTYKLPITLWDTTTQTQKMSLTTNMSAYPTFLGFSSDNTMIAGQDKEGVRIWNVNTGKAISTLKGHKGGVITIAFSPDNKTLVSAGYHDHTLRFWDIDTGKEKKTIDGYGRLFNNASLSHDGKTLMSFGFDTNNINLWNPNTGHHHKTFRGHEKGIDGAVLSPDGYKLVGYSYFDNTILLWDIHTQKLKRLKGPKNIIFGAAFSQNGQTLASWGMRDKNTHILKFWDVQKLSKQQTFKGGFGGLTDYYFDNKVFAGFHRNFPSLNVFDIATGKYDTTNMHTTDKGHSKKLIVAKFSPNGKKLALVFEILSLDADTPKSENNIELWNIETKTHQLLKGHSDKVISLAFSPNTRSLASGSMDKTIRLWDVETGTQQHVLTDANWIDDRNRNTGITFAIAFNHYGETLATGTQRGRIHLWNTTTGTKQNTLTGHTRPITQIFIDEKAQKLISASHDQTILIWNLTDEHNRIPDTIRR